LDLWLIENNTAGYSVNWKVVKTLFERKTPFQHLQVLETLEFGRTMVLDGAIQVTEKDEFIYHEMIAHIPLFSHQNPREVLVIGGGDGATVREILRHPGTTVDLVEIDQAVLDASREYFPGLACGLDDQRTRVIVADGIHYLESCTKTYDVVIIDASDPVGPAVGLFDEAFYRNVYRVLKADGIMVTQSESPFFNYQLLREINAILRKIFPLVKVYLTCVPSYIAGFWSFTAASKRYDPADPRRFPADFGECKYYTQSVHRAAFELPACIANLLRTKDCKGFGSK